MILQAQLKAQQHATAEQLACTQKLQEVVELGKGKLAESAAFVLKLQEEQSKAKEQICEYTAQVVLIIACNLSAANRQYISVC